MSTRCPICGAAAPPASGNPNRPFCSRRCKLVDLDRWLSGDYRVPGEPAEVGEDAAHAREEPQGRGQE